MTSAYVHWVQVFTSIKRQTCEQWGKESIGNCIIANSYTMKAQCLFNCFTEADAQAQVGPGLTMPLEADPSLVYNWGSINKLNSLFEM